MFIQILGVPLLLFRRVPAYFRYLGPKIAKIGRNNNKGTPVRRQYLASIKCLARLVQPTQHTSEALMRGRRRLGDHAPPLMAVGDQLQRSDHAPSVQAPQHREYVHSGPEDGARGA